jgi:hypothetical protein
MLADVPARGRRAADAAVYIESGTRRVFACALDWPGWCRSGKDEEQALAALDSAAPRYAVVAAEAGLAFTAGATFDVVEHLAGSATTDFGVPGEIASTDTHPLRGSEAKRVAALVSASWAVLDRVGAGAPEVLRKGPRGGGRDRDAMLQHVLSAEAAYARKIGIRLGEPSLGDEAAIASLRTAILGTLAKGSAGPAASEKGWPPRYAARRIAWHALDHAWEIEDRSQPRSSGPAPSP